MNNEPKARGSVTAPVIGELRDHWTSQLLGTGFKQFFWDGIDGLAKVENGELHLLSIIADTERGGRFREFIRQCKREYQFIRIWCVMNEIMPEVLARYGFVKGHDTDKFGEIQEVWDWRG